MAFGDVAPKLSPKIRKGLKNQLALYSGNGTTISPLTKNTTPGYVPTIQADGSIAWAAQTGGGSSSTYWSICNTTANFTFTSFSFALFATNSVTGSLPASPTVGTMVAMTVESGVTGCTIATTDGSKICGQTSPMNLDVALSYATFIYVSATIGWWITR